MILGRALIENTVVMILYDNTTTITSPPSSTPQYQPFYPPSVLGGDRYDRHRAQELGFFKKQCLCKKTWKMLIYTDHTDHSDHPLSA
jgi:hypothetical protein